MKPLLFRCLTGLWALVVVMCAAGGLSFATPDGDFTGTGYSDVSDALRALKFAVRLIQPTSLDIAHGDVAPLDPVTRIPTGNSKLDVADALEILRHAVGLDTWTYQAPVPTNLAAIEVTPASPVVVPAGSLQLTVTGTFLDNSTRDVTTSVAWTSSDSGVATVSPTGLVTAGVSGAGKAIITATWGSFSDATALFVAAPTTTTANAMPITVNGSLCSDVTTNSNGSYLNKPCVSVTICQPDNPTNCQTIGDILLDTGSYGLRIFKQALTIPLSQASSGSGSLAECVQFADGSSDWGSVKLANVVLGNETMVQVPIHVVDSSFGTSSLPYACSNPDRSPSDAGFTGILGVGTFTEDCGDGCTQFSGNGMYFTCNGSSCTGAAVALANQVKSPVAALAADNNGVVIELPAIATTGASSVAGSMLLGIGTRANNALGSATKFAVDVTGSIPIFSTTLKGSTFDSFLDSGSNAVFIPSILRLLPVCASDSEWFCPTGTQTFNATNAAASGSPSAPFLLQVGNFDSLSNTSNLVFSDLAGPTTDTEIDFGLPFFLGRNVFIGFEKTGSPAFWAY